ncbi:hypothetical protein P280DRAFT_492382 [Massarina eburnea CBS 473.64]|uniref:Diaminohydroxyphosphoribosylamino-pyrimidine deaminase n=1 Tax=Massarina eburnea CBS 473.64 TaxID=1395130 RepID=A0A6A6RQY9_9PLEO|nr:hypothetical protein P280DRAFT_492382 [Massarina eburnea CBS 473.64]
MDNLQLVLGAPMVDPEEEAFVVFSQAIPSLPLGAIDSNASELVITVQDKDLTIRQSRGLLTSNRKQGTTGAVVWSVTPLFADFIASRNFLTEAGYLGPTSIAIELGAGVSGIVALSLGPKIKKYIATDQDYVIRMLKQNIVENLSTVFAHNAKQKSKKKLANGSTQSSPNIDTLELDWELDSIAHLPSVLGLDDGQGMDVVIACDCIYNEALIEPLNTTCAQLCRLRTLGPQGNPTLCLVAQQLRSPDVFESWLKSFHRLFHTWQVPDELLTEALRENSGFIVYVGIVR